MEDLYAALTARLSAWVEAATGAAVKPTDFRLPRDAGQLSLGVFVPHGANGLPDAGEAAKRLANALPACPQVRAVREKNGWLLFYLSNAWFDGLIAWARALDTRPAGSYVENRMAMLSRKGDGPCPDEEPVRRALWAAYLACRRGAWRAADERLILTMTHHLTGMSRIELENRCGGVAAAIEKLKGMRSTMKITYLGHASFLLETAAGTRIVTDPYAQDILPHPVAAADIVTASHEHFDHCDFSQVKGNFVTVNTEECVTFRDVKITCAPCFHDEVQGQKRGRNRAYVFEADGLKIVHLGDLGEAPTPALVATCGGADVLFIPIGGTYTLTGEEAAAAVKALKPKLAVPMHYRCPGHSFAVISTEEPFLAALDPAVPVHKLDALTEPLPQGVALLTPQKP